ncbi:MAG: HNH endonuclease [Thermoplasmata archaeon]|nr:HNH endonuclease [Thermoplasmata archaeon]
MGIPGPVGPAVPQRILRDSPRWFSEGLARRIEARRNRRCVECQRPLASGRSPYCSRGCQGKYHGRFFWDSARRYVMRRDRYTCQGCGIRARRRWLEVDHIQEIARGGPSLEYENLQTLCRACHRTKTVAFLRSRHRVVVAAPDDSPPGDWFPA